MVKVSLCCAIVGKEGSAFPVDIDAGQLVGHLKDAIKAKNPNDFKDVDANKLQLFLAKKGDAWLPYDDPAAQDLDKGMIHQDVQALIDGEKMVVTWTVEDVLKANKMTGQYAPKSRQIHVLVVVPKGAGGDLERASLLSMTIQEDNTRMFHKLAEENRERDRKQAKEIRKLAEESRERDRKRAEEVHKLAEENREQNRKQAEEIRQHFEKFGNPATPTKTDSQLGYEHLELLQLRGFVSSAEVTVGADAFWSVEVQALVNSISRENNFDAFITPYFSNALDSHDLVFVNSEVYKLLPQSAFVGNRNTDLKPDGFVTHRGMYQKMPVPNDDVSRVGTSFRFGTAIKALFDCLVLFESKITKDLEGAPFGQVVRYTQHLFPKGPGSAVLFNRKLFWLIESINGEVVRVTEAAWVMEGSKALFRDFITKNLSPWVTRLTAACSTLNVEVVEGDAFLGHGAFGRVFKVKRVGEDGDVLALKIVEKFSIRRLFIEYEALVRAQDTGLVIRPVGDATEISDGAAMLLSPVGKPISYPTTSQEAQVLFDMLWQLHSAGMAHGDPRVPNMIVMDEQRLWIDLYELWDASPILMQNDAKILTKSILHVSSKDLLDSELESLINNYGTIPPIQANLNLLADKVGEKLEEVPRLDS